MWHKFIVIMIALTWTPTAFAQMGFGILSAPVSNQPQGTLDLLVEGGTYAPLFYDGRSEPSSGNQLELLAIPDGIDPNSLTYRWTINGSIQPSTSARLSLKAPIGNGFEVSVTASENGRFWGSGHEVIALSRPSVLFYEGNALKGLSNIALSTEYLLIGEEAEITAVPYFIGMPSSSLSGQWLIDGQPANLEGDWRQLVLTRPETHKERYRVSLDLINMSNLNESASNNFTLLMGL